MVNENEFNFFYFTGKLSKSHKMSIFNAFNERCNMHTKS